MFQRFRLPSMLVIAVLTATSMAQSPKATLRIEVDKPLHSVSPTLLLVRRWFVRGDGEESHL